MNRHRWIGRIAALTLALASAGTTAHLPATAHAQQLVRPQAAAPRIDVVFAIDATGSMGDEIEPVKQQVWSIARSIASGNPQPDVRFGLVVYRDRTDSEHTRMMPLTRNLDAFQQELMRVVAT